MFHDVLHKSFAMTDDMLMDRSKRDLPGFHPLISCRLVFRTFGKNHDNMMGVEEFVAGMSIFLRGSLDDQIKCELQPSANSPPRLIHFFRRLL